jgi:6-pyruvoyltetrahydropterin/6-carboxytetrahydropterin synthase
MSLITRRFEIDAGHRLMGHESKCFHLHGHRYAFEVTLFAAKLDKVGRVLDFGTVKELLGQWLEDHWDHAFIYQEGDPIAEFLSAHQMRSYPLATPPTAENLSRYFFYRCQELLVGSAAEVTRVVCFETPNCSAEYPS